ncbi:MAG TPA: FecR family protein [Spirochaetales bacterium]|nr:FecR family protein [Spirochaetales bacterium]
MKRVIALLALALAFAPLGAFAQSGTAAPSFVLEFVDGSTLTVVTPDGVTLAYGTGILEADSVPVGSTIKTGADTTAEFRMVPNKTLVKIARGTTIRLEKLGATPADPNVIALAAGKIRAVAAKGGKYEVKTPTTVAGVRGTDFTLSFEDGIKNVLTVKEGLVDFARLAADGSLTDSLSVAAGQFADAFSSSFQAAAFTAELFASEFGDVGIDELKIDAIKAIGADAGTGAGSDIASGDGTAADDGTIAEAGDEGEPSILPDAEPAVESALIQWMREYLGMEIGSIAIDGVTYSKAVLQPVIKLGKLEAALYLPIVYSSNLFDPADWYKPRGNDEWDFGAEYGWKEEPVLAAVDALRDTALKFRYLEYGEPLEDEFFFKLGNVPDFTVGHGLIVRNYANDADFPAVRKLGLNFGLDLGGWGFEALVNDALYPEIYGGRLYARPIKDFGLALGLQGVVDWSPARALDQASVPGVSAADVGDPIFISAGLDFDLPVVDLGIFSARLFAEGALTVPYTRTDVGTATAGLQSGLVWDGSTLRNWGAASGLMGNILFIDWRLEYRYFTGLFRPAFYDSGYDRKRTAYAVEYAQYYDDPIAYGDLKPAVMGIYGEGGGSILKDKLTFDFGYFWPWSPEAGGSLMDQLAVADDYFVARLAIKKGLIPLIDAAGSISYEHTKFVRTLAGLEGGDVTLFDENTVFKGEIVVPVPKAPGLDLAVLFSTATARDPATGEILFLGDGRPEIIPVISIETRLSF